jgi:zinc/manganese transport system substrate-binding protein
VKSLLLLLPLLLAALQLTLAGCAPARHGSGLQVVAAESSWGSIAAQLGGDRATVRSIVESPAVDPHSYEPTASDARKLAVSDVAVVNGLGYDRWASQLLAASPSKGRQVVDAGKVLGLGDGTNPHQWYSPASVHRMVGAIAAAYRHADPKDAAYFTARERAFERRGLSRYHALVAAIRARYAGTPVGYSESIFEPLGQSLGLRLLTPTSFARAVAEGTEVTATDKTEVASQIAGRRIAVWVYNSQNVTPEVDQLTALARRSGIPVVTVTETLSPEGASFQAWQSRQLAQLASALRRAAWQS